MFTRHLIKLGRSKIVWSLALICFLLVLYLHTHVAQTLPNVAKGKTEKWNERNKLESVLSDQGRNDDGVLTASSYPTRGEGDRARHLLALPDTRRTLASVSHSLSKEPENDGDPLTTEGSLSGVLKETQYITVLSDQPRKMKKWNQVVSGFDQKSKRQDGQMLTSEDYLARAEGDRTRLQPILSATPPQYSPKQDTEAPWSDVLTKVQPSASSKDTSHSAAASGHYCTAASRKSWKSEIITQLQPPVEKNCRLLQSGSRSEISRVKSTLKSWSNSESEQQWIQRMSNCSNVIEEFSNNFYISQEEIDFPLAYIFIVYTNARQVVRLLKAIYRPHNLYCIHPDARQGERFARVFRQISKCLDNVFVASKLEKVYYGHHSIMDAQLSCMKDLLVRYSASRWKYAINVCGREVPMKTNREIVSSLKKLNGYSALGDAKRVLPYTWRQRFQYKTILTRKGVWKTRKKMGPPPPGIQLYKSLTFIAASRQFASYMLTSKKAITFRNYLKPVYIPEEHFYASLYMLPEAPGGRPVDKSVKVPIVNDVVWLSSRWAKTHRWNICHGSDVHSVCVLDCYDLHTIFNHESNTFFFNKYFMEKDHIIMECAEEKLVQHNKQEYENDCS